MSRIVWHGFDYTDKAGTAPPAELHGEPMWVVENFYANGVTLAVFDGFTWCVLPSGSDDCSVSAWAEITYPEAP